MLTVMEHTSNITGITQIFATDEATEAESLQNAPD